MNSFDPELAKLAGFEINAESIVGGQSVVYRAHCASTSNAVALKVYHDKENTHQVLKEAAALATLNHPNLAKFVSVGYFNDQAYVATEWVEGERLGDVMRTQGPLTVDRAIGIARAMADGLSAAHELNIIHGDISPANVLIRPDGSPVIIDFGLGQTYKLTGATAKTDTLGTLRYVAPEIIKGEGPSFATDQYALGVLIYEMLTGTWPFDSQCDDLILQAASALHHHLYSSVDPLIEARPEISAQLDSTVNKAIHKRPECRYDSLAALELALQESPYLGKNARLDRTQLIHLLPADGVPYSQTHRRYFQKTTALLGVFIGCIVCTTLFVGVANTQSSVIVGPSVGALQMSAASSFKRHLHTINNQDSARHQRAVSAGCENLMPNPAFNSPVKNNFYQDPTYPDVVEIVHMPATQTSPLIRVGEKNRYGLYGQIVPIDAALHYTFTVHTYPSSGLEHAELIVSWLDKDWQLMNDAHLRMRIEQHTGQAVFDSIQVPQNAHFAVPSVYKNASEGTLLVDNLVFTQAGGDCT